MDVEFTSSSIPQRDFVELWRQQSRDLFGMRLNLDEENPCKLHLRGGSVGTAMKFQISLNGYYEAERGRDELRYGPDEYCLIMPLQGSSLIEDGKRRVWMRPGELTLIDCQRQMRNLSTSYISFIGMHVDRRLIETHLQTPGSAHLRQIRKGDGASAVVSHYLTSLVNGPNMPDVGTGEAVIDNLSRLIAIGIGANALAREADQAGAASDAKVASILRYIESNLAEADLTPACLADAFGISVRYLHKLFEGSGRSVSEAILERRLEACRQALLDPARRHCTISEIAFAWGFNDLSHFGRRFREAYGASPRALRAEAGL